MSQRFLNIALLGLAFAAAQAEAFVYEGRSEFSATGDFDGDGQPDLAIVDRATGAFRIGYRTAAGIYNWSDARVSGMTAADGISVGKLFVTTRDGLAIASTEGNRVNMFDAPAVNTVSIPRSVYIQGIGPNLVIAINLPGGTDTAHADLVIGSDQNNAPNPGQIALVRNNAGTTSLLSDSSFVRLASGNRLFLKTGGTEFAGAIARTGATDELRLFSPTDAGVNQFFTVANLARGSRFLYGHFGATIFNHVITYRPAGTSFISYLAADGPISLGAGATFDLGANIVQLIALPGAASDRLAAIFQNGTANIYSFDGASAPALIQEIAADAGEEITSILPTGGNNFMAFSGVGTTSQASRHYTASGGGYTRGARTVLPSLTPLSADANLFLFRFEPFVSAAPGLLRSLSAGDWTSDLAINAGAPPTFSANVWNFEGEALGLRNPSLVNFGSVAAGTGFGMANQYAPSISIFSRSPAVGDENVEINISPGPGEFKTAINVALSSPVGGAQFYYRLTPTANWILYSTPITLFKTTTMQYYGTTGAAAKSRIHTAEYIFPIDPATQDSDRDGVPDYVEIAQNLNPNGGKDSDGDGFTDLNELVAGTNPSNAASLPTDAQRLEEKAAFDLLLGLQPLDGVSGVASQAVVGVGVRTYDLSGSIFTAETTRVLGMAGVTDPAAKNTNIVLSAEPPLVVAATDAHFDIVTGSPDKRLGRELIGIVQAPRPAQAQVAYQYNGGALATEAAAWIASAQAAYAAVPRELRTGNLDVDDTLAALLFEAKVSDILTARGNPAGASMTLFPFRPTDSGKTNPPIALLASLEAPTGPHPAFRLADVHADLESLVSISAPAGMSQLRLLAKEIYRVSSLLNNAAPATYPSPVNILRDFIETGVLHPAYAAAVAGVNLASATAGANGALSLVDSRPLVNVELIIRNDTFGGPCTILDTTGAPVEQRSLVHPGGAQYRLLESFNLLPGSRVRVTGYSDVSNPACAGSAIEVLSISLDTVPAASVSDADGDLLSDALELLLFGSLSQTGMGDADGDGYSNLQEFFDGTDPEDAGGHGAAVADLTPPEIEITVTGTGEIVLTFTWPAAYFDEINFAFKATDELGVPFVDQAVTPVSIGANQFRVVLPDPGTDSKFYLLELSLN